MSESEVFPNAPITEAVLDIRVVPNPELELSTLKTIHGTISDHFPHAQGLAGVEGAFLFGKGEAQSQTSVRATGFLFRSEDETRVVQVTQSGFTYNKLKPYDRWETFRDEARHLWHLYRELAQVQNVTRIALRYINRIELPLPFTDFKEYILTVPEVPTGIAQGLAHFFMRLEIPYQDPSAIAVVTVAMDQSGLTESVVPIILDIDVFSANSFTPDSEEMWDSFEALRRLKNQVFRSSITAKTKELFR